MSDLENTYANDDGFNAVPLFYALLVSSLAIPFGFEIGSLYTNLKSVNNTFFIDYERLKILLSAYFVAVTIGIFLSGWITYSAGRKTTLLSSGALGCAALLSSVVAPNFQVFMCSFLVLGISFGIYLLSSIIYLSEIMLPVNRGFAICTIPLMVLLGALISIVFNNLYVDRAANFEIIGLCFIFVLIIIYCTIKMPESPRYLALLGLTDSALAILFKLRHNMGAAAHELASINECSSGELRGFDFFMQNYNFRRCVLFYVLLSVLINLSGFAYITHAIIEYIVDVNFIQSILRKYHFTYGLLVAGITGSLCVAFLIDKIGRANMLIYSILGGISSLVLALVIALDDNKNIVILISLAFYTFFSVMVCSVFITSFIEMMPARGREFGATVVLFVNTILIILSSKIFTLVVSSLGTVSLIIISIGLSSILSFIVFKFMPNIKKITLETIENRLLSGKSFHDLKEEKNKNG